MTKRTERTSPRIARLAGRILAIEDEPPANEWRPSWKEIRAMAASVLTQAADKKPKRKKGWIARKISLRNKRGGKGHSG